MPPSMFRDMNACIGPSEPAWTWAKRGLMAGASRVAGNICRKTAAMSQCKDACFASMSEGPAGRGSVTRGAVSHGGDAAWKGRVP